VTVVPGETPGTIRFPEGPWIPNPTQIVDSAATILAVAGAALDSFGVGGAYERRTYTHGVVVPWYLNVPQLIVRFDEMAMGYAGQQQYQWASGDIGKLGNRFLTYIVEVVNVWPKPKGGIAPKLADDESLMAAAGVLWRDGLIVHAALNSAAQGGSSYGVLVNPPIGPIQQSNILVSPMQTVGPLGNLAAVRISVLVQF
jgi:hypothetical protein